MPRPSGAGADDAAGITRARLGDARAAAARGRARPSRGRTSRRRSTEQLEAGEHDDRRVRELDDGGAGERGAGAERETVVDRRLAQPPLERRPDRPRRRRRAASASPPSPSSERSQRRLASSSPSAVDPARPAARPGIPGDGVAEEPVVLGVERRARSLASRLALDRHASARATGRRSAGRARRARSTRSASTPLAREHAPALVPPSRRAAPASRRVVELGERRLVGAHEVVLEVGHQHPGGAEDRRLARDDEQRDLELARRSRPRARARRRRRRRAGSRAGRARGAR